MSNLNSIFDVYKGWPNGSALEFSAKPATAGITEGKIVALSSIAPVGTAAAATVVDPAVGAVIDVFIDPAVGTDFVTAAVADGDILDVAHNAHADMLTITDGKTIFDTAYAAAGGKTLFDPIGKKRLRASNNDWSTARTGQTVDYAARAAILKSEDPASSYLVVDVDAIVWNNNGGFVRITKAAGDFTGTAVGDVAHITGGAVAGNNSGFIITARTNDRIDLGTLTYVADANSGLNGFQVQVYHPVIGVTAATATHATQRVTLAASGMGTAASAGDILFIVQDALAAANIGMWIIDASPDADTVHVLNDVGYNLADSAASVSCCIFTPKASSGRASVTVRKRLTRLYDTGAAFTGVVTEGRDDIVMPWPVDIDPTHFDTTTTRWPVLTVVDDYTLDADLDDDEELAPELFIAGYAANAPYRIDIYDDTAKATLATSSQAQHTNGSIFPKDQMWLVIQGNDQYDGNFTDRLALLKLGTGIVYKVASTIANTLAAGDFVYANAGVLAKVTRAANAIGGSGAKYSTQKQIVGVVGYSNNTAGANGYVIIVDM